MIATTIGRTFLKAYNEKNGKQYSAKEFFEKEYFEVFFNHPKYMQWVTNSPFVQMKGGQKVHLLTSEERLEKLEDFGTKIKEGIQDASIAIGYPASEIKEFATTSGGITDISLDVNADDTYLSWIGGGFGIGVSGGYSIFFDSPEILLQVFEGWKVYRGFLNDSTIDKLRGNQINTWNGQWLSYSYSKDYRKNFDFRRLVDLDVFALSDAKIEVNTLNWSELFFNLSREYSNRTYVGYVYSLGQTNKTLGFYPFHLKGARKLIDYYGILFGENAAINDTKEYEKLFGLHIKRACELGSIGLQALEPKDLRKYFGKDANLKLVKAPFKAKTGETTEETQERKKLAQAKDEKNIITYRTYKTWLLAMITKNKEESLEYTLEVAKALHEYRSKATKLDRKNLIQLELLATKSKKMFLDTLTTIIQDVEFDTLELFKELRDKVHMMTSEDFGYFVVLLKFDYAYQEREINK